MVILNDVFDFNSDGKESLDEELFAFGMISAISDELSEDFKIDANDSNLLDEEADCDPFTPITINIKKDAEDIGSDLEKLREKLSDLEAVEPDDTLNSSHDRWDDRCEILCEAISDMEFEVQERIGEIQEKLDDLEFDEPENYFSSAHDRWEELCDELHEQISELEALL